MTKKQYIAPTINIIDMELENIMAGSIKIDKKTTVDSEWSNKREPVSNSWGSQNWNAEEEF